MWHFIYIHPKNHIVKFTRCRLQPSWQTTSTYRTRTASPFFQVRYKENVILCTRISACGSHRLPSDNVSSTRLSPSFIGGIQFVNICHLLLCSCRCCTGPLAGIEHTGCLKQTRSLITARWAAIYYDAPSALQHLCYFNQVFPLQISLAPFEGVSLQDGTTLWHASLQRMVFITVFCLIHVTL